MNPPELKPEVVIVNYLYVVRVELSTPLRKGNWKTSRIGHVIYSPRDVWLKDDVLEISLPSGTLRRIVAPVLWDVGEAIRIDENAFEDGWHMWPEREINVDSPDPAIASWTKTKEGGVLLATLFESGKVVKIT